jgi:hypothetical protein
VKNAYKVFVGRPRRSYEDYVRIDLREIAWKVVYWIHLAQYRDQWRAVVNKIMKLGVQ